MLTCFYFIDRDYLRMSSNTFINFWVHLLFVMFHFLLGSVEGFAFILEILFYDSLDRFNLYALSKSPILTQ